MVSSLNVVGRGSLAPISPARSDGHGGARAGWLAQRFAEREVFQASEKKRGAAVRHLATANRQVQEALNLVLATRASAESAAKRATADDNVAAGPRLFDGAAG